MKNIVISTYAEHNSGGTAFAWMETDKTIIDSELIKDFYKKFSNIKEIFSLSINSKEIEKETGLVKNYDYVNSWSNNKQRWNELTTR